MAERLAVIGAGLAGSLIATLLGRRGLEVTVYERRADPRVIGAEAGRSINLALSARGLDALERVGLAEQALARALPMYGRMIHPPPTATPRLSGVPPLAGGQSFRPYSADRSQAINSIGRAELNHLLLDAAEATPGVTLKFGHRLRTLDPSSGQLSFETDAGRRRPRADIVLACDGSYSAARAAVMAHTGFSHSQDYLDHGYLELTIPPCQGAFALAENALHIWPRGESMMIALPNPDRSFTATLFWPTSHFGALDTPETIIRHFREQYPDAFELIPTLVEDYLRNPVGSLVTIRCWPWVHRGQRTTLALLGDAAHAVVPFYGQGANCALEDCIELDASLGRAGGDWRRALDDYQRRRKPDCDVIAQLSLANFVEMRDRVRSPAFRAATAAEHALERALGGRYASRYELISFSTIPYADVPARLRRQRRTVVAAGLVLLAGTLGAAWRLRRRHRHRAG